MALKTKKLTSLMPKGSAPVNSLKSANTSNTTKTYGRSLTNVSGFSRRSQTVKPVKQSFDKSSSSNSVAIPVPTSSIFSAEMEESQDSVDNNDDLVVLDHSEKPNFDTSNNNIGKVRSVKKVILISEGNHEDMITDESIQITIKDGIVSIRSTEGFLMNIPFEKVRQFKIANKEAFCGIIMFVMLPTAKRIKNVVKQIETVVVQLKNPLSLKTAGQIARGFNVKLLKFTLAESSRFSLRIFDPIPAADFTHSGRSSNENALSKITNQMDTDFSSLERRVRRGNTRGKVTYEELNDNQINEIMLGENGTSKIYGYIPDSEQLYFEPNLKVKLDNKKTFSISNNEFKCLYNDNWVNDTIIDFVTAYLLHTAKEENIPKAQNIEIMNSFFFTSLSRPVEDQNYYKNVKSWFKKVDDLFDKDYIIIPINQDLHWYFVVISGLKQLKRRYLKRKAIEDKSTTNIDPQANTDNLTSDDAETHEDKAVSLSDEIQKNSDVSGDPVTNASTGRAQSEEPATVNEYDYNNNGDIIPVRSPIKNKRKLIDDDTGELRADNRPPGAAQISVLNSLRKNHDKAILLLRHFLLSYAKDKYDIDINPQDIFKKICLVPQQKNLNDCGIHVLFNIQTMLQNPTEFDKVILKRPTGNKMRNKAKFENEKFFDKNRLLNYREELRNLLFDLLKKQVEAENGDSSVVGSKTVGQKLMEAPTKMSIGGSNGTETDSKSKSTTQNKHNGDVGAESDDDLVITHFREKTPVLETKSPSPKPRGKKPKHKISIIGVEREGKDDIDMMASDSDFEPSKGAANLTSRRKLNVKRSKLSDYNVASSLSPSPLLANNDELSSKKTKSPRITEIATEDPTTKPQSPSTLDSDSTEINDKIESTSSTPRMPLLKTRRRARSTELLSQDSFNGDIDGVKLIDSDDDDDDDDGVEMIDENQPIPQNSTLEDTPAESSEGANIQSTNSAELLMQDIDKEITSQDSEKLQHQDSVKQDKETDLTSAVMRRFRNSTIARISGSKQSIPIEITDEHENHVVEVLDFAENPGDPDLKLEEPNSKDEAGGIEFLKSVSPESETNIRENSDDNNVLGLSKTQVVNVDTRETAKRNTKISDNSPVAEQRTERRAPLKVRVSSIRILKDLQPRQKHTTDGVLDFKENLTEPKLHQQSKDVEYKPKSNIKDEISTYLSKSDNSSPIKLQSESPNKEDTARNYREELNIDRQSLRLTKRKLDIKSSEPSTALSEKIVESPQLTESSNFARTENNFQPSRESSVQLPLYATRGQSPREDLKPISESLFSKSKLKLKPASKSKIGSTQRFTRSSSPVVETIEVKPVKRRNSNTAHHKANRIKNKERSVRSETQQQNNKRNRSEELQRETDEVRFSPKKKTRSNYRVSDTELKNSLYYDKYCGNVYSERKPVKRKSRDFQTRDVYTALRSKDDYTVNFTSVPSSFSNDEYFMDKSDVEIVRSDDEDTFVSSKLRRDDSYGSFFDDDADSRIGRRAGVSRFSNNKF